MRFLMNLRNLLVKIIGSPNSRTIEFYILSIESLVNNTERSINMLESSDDCIVRTCVIDLKESIRQLKEEDAKLNTLYFKPNQTSSR